MCLGIALLVFIPLSARGETLTEIRDRIYDLSEQKDNLQKEITAFDSQLQFLTAELSKTDQEIARNEESLKTIEAELKIQNEYLAESIRAIYEEDRKSFFELFFSSKTLSEFINRSEYMEVNRQRLKENSDRVKELKDQAEQTQTNLAFLKEMQRVLKESLEAQKNEKTAQLTTVLAEEKRIREKFSARLLSSGKNPYCKGGGRVIKAKKPVFAFPVECGYISQGFGMTEFATLDLAYNGKMHNGFDVGVGTGTRILSVGNGTVYAKGTSPSGGWGNWVMVKQDKVKIDNREVEFYSLYAHMVAESHLKVGDRVAQNAPVGFVGGTPDWAPHLHFSLFLSNSGWSNGITGPYPGNVVDPLDYMDIPISVEGTDWDLNYLHL